MSQSIDIYDLVQTDYEKVLKLKPAINSANFDDVLSMYKVDANKKPSKEEHVIKIHECRALTLGNISNFTAPSKAGKSTLSAFFIALLISEGKPKEGQMDTILQSGITDGRNGVVRLDTEMGTNDIKSINQRVKRLAGIDHITNFHSYELGSSSSKTCDLLEVIEMIIELHASDCSLFIIDQVADLVDFNDINESRDLVLDLMYLAKVHNIHILTIIHTKKDGLRATGHLGSMLEKKVELLLRLENDEENKLSNVHADYTRGPRLDSFSFGYVVDPNSSTDFMPQMHPEHVVQNKKSTAFGPHSLTGAKHKELLHNEFEMNETYLLSEVKDKIGNGLGRMGAKASGRDVVKRFLQYYKDSEFFSWDTDKKPSRHSEYTFTGIKAKNNE